MKVGDKVWYRTVMDNIISSEIFSIEGNFVYLETYEHKVIKDDIRLTLDDMYVSLKKEELQEKQRKIDTAVEFLKENGYNL
jgi:hypothetical protein